MGVRAAPGPKLHALDDAHAYLPPAHPHTELTQDAVESIMTTFLGRKRELDARDSLRNRLANFSVGTGSLPSHTPATTTTSAAAAAATAGTGPGGSRLAGGSGGDLGARRPPLAPGAPGGFRSGSLPRMVAALSASPASTRAPSPSPASAGRRTSSVPVMAAGPLLPQGGQAPAGLMSTQTHGRPPATPVQVPAFGSAADTPSSP